MTEKNGPILGKIAGNTIRYNGDRHLVTVAPNGAGKDVSCVTLNAMTYRGSMVICDVLGQTAKLTARYRAEVLKQKVYIFDPFSIVPDEFIPMMRGDARSVQNPDGTYRTIRKPLRARFNLIDLIRMSPTPVATAKMISAAMIIPDEGKPHWSNGARSMFGAFTVFAALEPSYEYPRNLSSVWSDLHLDNVPQIDEDGKKHPGNFDYQLSLMMRSKVADGYPSREATIYCGEITEEVKSFRHSIFTNCGIFDDPEIMESLSESDLNFADLQREPITVYLCLPGRFMDSHSRWMRLMLSCILASIETAGLRATDTGRPRTLFILNEFASLKKSDTLLEALPRMRNYGCQFWIIVQDLSQLRYHYKDAWETFISNAGVVQAFGGALDRFTSEYLSKMSGEQTRTKTSTGENSKPLTGVSTNVSTFGRPVLFPSQISTMNADPQDKLKQLLIFAGLGCSVAERLLWYKDLPPDDIDFVNNPPPPGGGKPPKTPMGETASAAAKDVSAPPHVDKPPGTAYWLLQGQLVQARITTLPPRSRRRTGT